MGRSAILLLGIAFTVALGALTLRDLSQHGATVPGVFGVIVTGLFAVALIGALFHPPRR
ncbi:MAG TPA: hypothetical protein VKT31_03030 [Solirubrobacteraceae bacterium]|nr:hypothetical protein [Solirubrobacteraceae bacterium]